MASGFDFQILMPFFWLLQSESQEEVLISLQTLKASIVIMASNIDDGETQDNILLILYCISETLVSPKPENYFILLHTKILVAAYCSFKNL